jgi:hypothetical protein
MKYSRLTKEQFEALHKEFALFLAALGIDASHWKELKTTAPEKVNALLDTFSDQVWEDVFNKATYLEQWEEKQVLFIHTNEEQMHSLLLKAPNAPYPIVEEQGWQWVMNHIHTDDVLLYQGVKKYNQERKITLFEMIIKGAQLSDGKKYEALKAFFLTQ